MFLKSDDAGQLTSADECTTGHFRDRIVVGQIETEAVALLGNNLTRPRLRPAYGER